MTITRSFGFVIKNGLARYFYAGGDGVKRWSDTDKPVDSESDYISAMSAGIPPFFAPDPIATDEDKCRCSLRTRLVGDGCQYCNPKLHAELLADEAEHGICALPMTPEEEAEQVNLRG